MSDFGIFSIVGFVGYILGSISFAVIVARKYGIDILKVGSGNAGSTNVNRVLGKTPGYIVFLLDMLKGVVATAWPAWIFSGNQYLFLLMLLGMVSAIIGHTHSIFLKFRGGKGIATTMGGSLVLMPTALGAGLIVWALVFLVSRYVSLASICFGVSLPIAVYFLYEDIEHLVFALALMLFIIIKHIPNIKRLLNAQEHRFIKKN